jgi:predicted secreted protein
MSRLVAVLALLSLATVGWAGPSLGTVSAGRMTVRESANGHSVSLHRGDLLVVALRGSSGTGYAWETKSFDHTIMRSLPTRYAYDHPGMPGGGETSNLRFIAKQPGKTTLQVLYVRPWDRSHPARQFVLYVTVD